MPIFDPATLRTTIAHTLEQSDLGNARNAFVAVVTRDAQGQIVVRGAVSTKIGDHWTVSALVGIDRQAHVEGGIEIKATW
jgi:hypothetical protein